MKQYLHLDEKGRVVGTYTSEASLDILSYDFPDDFEWNELLAGNYYWLDGALQYIPDMPLTPAEEAAKAELEISDSDALLREVIPRILVAAASATSPEKFAAGVKAISDEYAEIIASREQATEIIASSELDWREGEAVYVGTRKHSLGVLYMAKVKHVCRTRPENDPEQWEEVKALTEGGAPIFPNGRPDEGYSEGAFVWDTKKEHLNYSLIDDNLAELDDGDAWWPLDDIDEWAAPEGSRGWNVGDWFWFEGDFYTSNKTDNHDRPDEGAAKEPPTYTKET